MVNVSRLGEWLWEATVSDTDAGERERERERDALERVKISETINHQVKKKEL